jgi:hypothetical protein
MYLSDVHSISKSLQKIQIIAPLGDNRHRCSRLPCRLRRRNLGELERTRKALAQ